MDYAATVPMQNKTVIVALNGWNNMDTVFSRSWTGEAFYQHINVTCTIPEMFWEARYIRVLIRGLDQTDNGGNMRLYEVQVYG